MATKKRTDEYVALYNKLIATIPKLERKGAANPYTSMNGNMFTILHQSRTLAIRLPEAEREAFIKKYKTSLFESYGAVMKEYVTRLAAEEDQRTGISFTQQRVREDSESQTHQEASVAIPTTNLHTAILREFLS